MTQTATIPPLIEMAGRVFQLAMELKQREQPVPEPMTREVCVLEVQKIQQTVDEIFAGQNPNEPASSQGTLTVLLQRGDMPAPSQSSVNAPGMDKAKYALMAYIDEVILTSNLPFRDVWAEAPLQLRYFNDFGAGEQFFVKLNELRKSQEVGAADALEIYFLCLAMGFKGKFATPAHAEQLRLITEKVASEVLKARSGTSILSPNWQPPDFGPKVAARRWSYWFWPGLVSVLLMVMFVVFNNLLGAMAQEIARIAGK